jgi:hypothetical protein
MNDNKKNDLALLADKALQDGSLREEDITALQANLLTLLAERVKSYTMGDSSSVPIEIAEQLYQSICFSIGLYLKASDHSLALLITASPKQVLKAAWAEIEAQIKIGKKLLRQVKATRSHIKNISYEDTLKEVTDFFKNYDYRLFAHEIPCSIDYQLSSPVNESLKGIEYINEYLRRLLIENTFCQCFHGAQMAALLYSYSVDYIDLLINLYEPAAINAVALSMLKGNILELDISPSQRELLSLLFQKWSEDEAKRNLFQAAEDLCDFLDIQDAAAKDYLKKTALAAYPRIKAALPAHRLDKIFLSLSYTQTTSSPDILFIDEDHMADEQLRTMIDEMLDCASASKKTALVKENIHSLKDLIEILNACFWGEECIVLFDAFKESELDLLQYFLDQQQDDWSSASGWENQFKTYKNGK